MPRTALRICPLCEATCGLTLTIDGTAVTGARGDREDVFSRGFICPKGAAFGQLDADPDRLRRPLVRRDGRLRDATWEEAYDAIAAAVPALVGEYGAQSAGVVLGNPNVHTMAGALYPPLLLKALGTRNLFTASTLDQMPKHVSSGLLFGDPFAIPVPDLDRTDFLLLLGANPVESNGSLCTAPDFPGRLKALRARGGTLVVVDPRRTRTARLADRHLAPRPGSDALLLAALAHTLLSEKLAAPGAALEEITDGLGELAAALGSFTPEAVAPACDLPAAEIRTLARELAAAPTAAVYGRIGSSTVEYGTLASWLVDVLNILTGNLDRPGGALFPLSATAGAPRPAGPGRGFALGRWSSRVSGHPEAKGELPLAALAEEIETPGDGRIRVLLAIAANPVLSAPDGDRLDRALAGLDFMVSVDPYLNETSRHAHVVLPPPPPAQSAHFDFAFNGFAVRNQARYSPAAVPLEAGRLDECEIHARLVLAVSGLHGAPPEAVDERVIADTLARAVDDPRSPLHGRDPDEEGRLLSGRTGPERRLDLMLRLGPYGLTLDGLRQSPHGIDLGPLRPRLPGLLKTRSGRIELLPDPIATELPRLRAALAERPASLVLVGRRHLRSNNSWLHNVPALTGGSNRCTLHVHPQDADRLGLTDGARARITADGGSLEVPVEVTDTVRTGVVSLPHGWGHDRAGTRLSVASAEPGVNVNQLLDGSRLDPLSGTAVLNGFPVELAPLP
ncbi:molybdopterin oxidoreductase family protein [Streptomyces antarcticus]|uniref:molybdopterin oxidoreductase family protein n=1 Tax=Streptomyces antarcticus TaxID=2996458 RepID=UPI00226F2DE4|nr:MULTISPECIES: molybdopterin oxidoreductase family protein [unclassified Streptomyces]MCY0947728.1 molybdopterin oxidoreductase family protein [Streptomyces sp. H34-AA3]MCY0952348.1 molybdopterin oxidoreductase family protein [Streptomyces sp. H27-S2]MCZ4088187.1 molybdopterin oxidoreductase family protein [Streptomyces sp. H34-S5]